MRYILVTVILIFLSFVLAQNVEIHFIDVGQGDSVLIRSPTGQNVLYDGGRAKDTTLNYLKFLGIQSLDLVIASHPDADHIGGLIEVVSYYKPRFFMDNEIEHTTLTYESLLLAVEAADSTLIEPTSRQINLGDVVLQILPPPNKTSWSSNNNSVGVILKFGEFKAGFTGDAEVDEFNWWIKNYSSLIAPLDVYKSSHHGSANGDTTLAIMAFKPKTIVISVGLDNSYGHPAEVVLNRYEAIQAEVYRTDLQGTIIVRADKSGSYTTSFGQTPQPQREIPNPVIVAANVNTTQNCININQANTDELEKIVHIGKSRAEDIIRLRPFKNLNELTRIAGISSNRLNDIVQEGLACVK